MIWSVRLFFWHTQCDLQPAEVALVPLACPPKLLAASQVNDSAPLIAEMIEKISCARQRVVKKLRRLTKPQPPDLP
jgi:hypothetical protein